MVGFTELSGTVNPEVVLQDIIRRYEDACAVCVTRYEGYVYQRLGDGIVAFFGYPLAHEGEAERAIHAGPAIIDSLAQLEVPVVGRLHARIGIAGLQSLFCPSLRGGDQATAYRARHRSRLRLDACLARASVRV